MSSMSVDETRTAPRMKAADRRELILAAATAVFGAKSYVGTTTDEVARAAGVSQPYVVRLFGTKAKLYTAVIERAYARIIEDFRRALPGPPEGRRDRMATAYAALLEERGMLPVIANSTALGGDPELGPVARAGFNSVWRFVRDEAEFSEQETRDFMANGMLINAIVGLRLVGAYGTEAAVTEMLDSCLPGAGDRVRGLLPAADEPW
ncbi:helix-turn-helix domain-containing protein [Agromyces sp. H66]|uniref:TetR/AcrR family transcriptional regulator n=1 Tax=Agromyces sp. H66 TaxID=2529859 RepID=UPI0010AA22F1|nr:helix-turn-helix domain-containing protein [Agromyces sp. H66]